ncbi:MAG: OsmC family protein [Sandaracinaceae bacterium]|nr:OsmC family protein [Sandaracinaceae bacterium]
MLTFSSMELVLHGSTELEVARLDEPGLAIRGDAGGEGFGPLQMLAASLALCTASVLHVYGHEVAKTGIGDLSIDVEWSYGERPNRVDRFAMTIRWPSLPEERRAAAERAAASCTVHRTFEHPPEVITRVERS